MVKKLNQLKNKQQHLSLFCSFLIIVNNERKKKKPSHNNNKGKIERIINSSFDE